MNKSVSMANLNSNKEQYNLASKNIHHVKNLSNYKAILSEKSNSRPPSLGSARH